MPRKVNLVTCTCIAFLTLCIAAFDRANALFPFAGGTCERPWQVVKEYPHDPTHFTQGLLITRGRMFESVGLYGRSAIHEIDLASGRALKSRTLPVEIFSEGLALAGDRLVQVTWREQTALVYDLDLRLVNSLAYFGEGWGLTTASLGDEERLILSDGTPWLRFLDPATLEEKGRVKVKESGEPVAFLNELEQVGNEVLANIWHSDRVVAIDLPTGQVMSQFDFSALRERLDWPSDEPPETDLNGLAFDARSGHLLVTGKFWPKLFEVKFAACGASLPDH